MKFKKLNGRPDSWDRDISLFETKTLFHQSCWLDHMNSIHPDGKIIYYEIHNGGELVGYHCGLQIKKMGIPIHGSPLGGTGTNFMGPIVNTNIDQRALIKAMLKLFGLKNFLHLEMSHFWLNKELMAELGFSVYPGVTHLIKLPDNKEDAWNMLKSVARNRVRKAEKNALIVTRVTDGSVVDDFYQQFIEVYGKQGMVTPFGVGRPRSLYNHLYDAGALLPLTIKHGDEVIAAGLFPYDENCIYFWGAGSWLKDQKLCPNELLQWHVIKFAVERKIRAYNMCGGSSQFKNKFGGDDVDYVHYSKSALPFMQQARNWYKNRHFRALKK